MLFINVTDRGGDTVISRFAMVDSVADVESEEVLLTIPQPRANHNGGQLAFGPDGYLYIGMGDGGGGGDPGDHGQNPKTLLGSILRIDVDTAEGYIIPPDNPFSDGEAPEVFVWGIRNAWRFGFDSVTGDLWIGDVGQDRFEEVTVLRAAEGSGNGANLGWNEAEGAEPYRGGTIPDDHVGPVIAYGHASDRCSITGGEVYRGDDIAELKGTYIYGDFCTGEVFGFRVDESTEPARLDLRAVSLLSSFGLDAAGEIYALSGSGGVFRIVSG
ncbi:MAG: glucose/arabinose dehydrogenase [Verrucomicrobiales bacterium]|jgi:glucose/arabinose dehydrogenase